jgi:ectoine hydroxylase-related dioxygenase (phytanoyl-CoA dioxygenase family)
LYIGHPVWNLRVKPPYNEQASVPWHQDNAYFDPTALYTHILGSWIPLIDATKENGCMQVYYY